MLKLLYHLYPPKYQCGYILPCILQHIKLHRAPDNAGIQAGGLIALLLRYRLVDCSDNCRRIRANQTYADVILKSCRYRDDISGIVKRHAIPSKPVVQIIRCVERSACIVQHDCTVSIIRRGQTYSLDAERITSHKMDQTCCVIVGTNCSMPALLTVRAVVGDLVVHPIWDVGRQQGFVIAQRFATPHNVHIIRRQSLAMGDVYVAIEIVNNFLDCPLNKFLRIRYSSSPLSYNCLTCNCKINNVCIFTNILVTYDPVTI